ncbi:hypothetical protein Q7P35_003118 [Cladosporium inversicolor]
MPHIIDPLRIQSLDASLRKDTKLGAEVHLPTSMNLLDIPSLSKIDKETLQQALFAHGVLVIRNQAGLEPKVLVELAKLFDPAPLDHHSGGTKQVTDPNNILSLNNCSRIPDAPQVTVIGKGRFEDHQGLSEVNLQHLDHLSFHEKPLSSEAIREGFTRPYRWHMDAPLYENLPGIATVLHAVQVPDLPDQRLAFDDGKELEIAAGATAFFSGARNFELLSNEQKQFALHTTVQYAPRAYEWIKDCKATADGLSIARVGREKAESDLPVFEPEKVHSFPLRSLTDASPLQKQMVFRNPSTLSPSLQIAGCCVQALHTRNPATNGTTTISDLAEVRRICRSLQQRAYSPATVYAHRWREGDVVIFHNRGVMHSITGQLAHHPQRRLLWQCNMASLTPVVPFVEGVCKVD